MTDTIDTGGISVPSGELSVTPIHGSLLTLEPGHIRTLTDPKRADSEEAADWRSDNCRRVRKQAKRLHVLERKRLPAIYGVLFIKKFDAHEDEWIDFGLASLRVVTDTGVQFIVDAFQNLVELENMKHHGTGTGTTGELANQAALITEITTGLNPDSLRAVGTTTEVSGPSSNIYQTVGVNTYDATLAITEHGIFSQAATGGGVMLDRSVFAAVNLVSGDSLQTDYRLTVVAGS